MRVVSSSQAVIKARPGVQELLQRCCLGPGVGVGWEVVGVVWVVAWHYLIIRGPVGAFRHQGSG